MRFRIMLLAKKVVSRLMGMPSDAKLKCMLFSDPRSKKPNRKAGSAKHLGIIMADDFDEPLDDFAEYMS